MAEERPPGAVRRLSAWLNSGVGLMFLGALVTTGGGTWLSYVVQESGQRREQEFEIFKIRLDESRKVQEELLTLASSRAHHLFLVHSRLEDADVGEPGARQYWAQEYRPVKDEWSRKVAIFQSRLKVLFPAVDDGPLAGPTPADLFFAMDEAEATIRDIAVLERMAAEGNLPKTVHGSLATANMLVLNALDACRGRTTQECRQDPWMRVSRIHLKNAWNRIATLADALTLRLHHSPYGTQDPG